MSQRAELYLLKTCGALYNNHGYKQKLKDDTDRHDAAVYTVKV